MLSVYQSMSKMDIGADRILTNAGAAGDVFARPRAWAALSRIAANAVTRF